jgi:AraC-like DNA-binding protein
MALGAVARNPGPPASDSWGFRIWRGAPSIMPEAHQHTDIEINFILTGWMRYFMAGRFVLVPSSRLVAMWAGMPHRLVDMAEGTRCIWITIPLSWFLSWGLKHSFSNGLLGGELMIEQNQELCELDRALHQRWVEDFESEVPERREIATLEVEARMRRLALGQHRARPAAAPTQGLSRVDRMAAFISAHYTEDVSVSAIARSAKLHPNYAMTLFKKCSGMSIREYVTRLRVWHAQRLLLTTDAKVLEVMLESGFKSASRFYDTFAKVVGTSPRDFRAQHRPRPAPLDLSFREERPTNLGRSRISGE